MIIATEGTAPYLRSSPPQASLWAIAWLGNKTTQARLQAKQRWTTFQESTHDRPPSDIAAETSKTVLNSSKTVMEQIPTIAKKQVGILDDENK